MEFSTKKMKSVTFHLPLKTNALAATRLKNYFGNYLGLYRVGDEA